MAARLLEQNPAGGVEWVRDGLIGKAKEVSLYHNEKRVFT